MAKPQLVVTSEFMDALFNIPRSTQRKVLDFAKRFTIDPRSPGINYEKLKGARDEKIRTVRIDLEYRAVVIHPPKGNVYTLVWVDHHDAAINWAINKEFRIGPQTGLLHVFNIDEKFIAPRQFVPTGFTEGLFEAFTDKDLQKCGIPAILLPVIRNIEEEEELEELRQVVSPEIYDILLCLGAGYTVQEIFNELSIDTEREYDPDDYAAAFRNPSNKRHFAVVETVDELAEMLAAPMDKWRVFLHPTQEILIHRTYSGPALVTGGPGTGKTVVAMHRAKYLAEKMVSNGGRVLFTTFNINLAKNIEKNMEKLCSWEARQRLEITHLHSWAYRFLDGQGLRFGIAREKDLEDCWKEAMRTANQGEWGLGFCREEWETVIQHRGIESLQEYLEVIRYGRGARLARKEREELYAIFSAFIAEKKNRNILEWYDVLTLARKILEKSNIELPYQAIIVDEAQDMEAAAFKLLRAMVPSRENDLFIVGDVHQRIYRRPVTLSDCGIKVRGRSRNLKVNYRTTAQIGKWAINMVKGFDYRGLDGEKSSLHGYRSLLRGKDPVVNYFNNAVEEKEFILATLKDIMTSCPPENICLVARRTELVKEYADYLAESGLACRILDRGDPYRKDGYIKLGTIHRVKGLEFNCVFIVAANDGIIPLTQALKGTSDSLLYAENLQKERSLLFVAATRARDLLFVTGYGKPSRFLQTEPARRTVNI